MKLTFKPLVPVNWHFFEELFLPDDGCGGCWCMWWKLSRSNFRLKKGEANRTLMKDFVFKGGIPGLIGFFNNRPVAWVAIDEKKEYPALMRSTIFKTRLEKNLWAITCFYLHRKFRRQGFLHQMIDEAVLFAGINGAEVIEAYPVNMNKTNKISNLPFTGVVNTFQKAGFLEVYNIKRDRPIMRYLLNQPVLG